MVEIPEFFAILQKTTVTHFQYEMKCPLFITMLFLFVGCTKTDSNVSLTIIVSGDTEGWIVPCGCTSNQSGGLPRRATFIDEQRKQGLVILADVGGTPSGTTVYDKLKFEAILRGQAVMGVAAHNIGQAEAACGIDELQRLSERWQTPWVSANTTDAAGKPLVPPAKIITSGNKKILFIGVLSQKYATESVRVTPPRRAVLKVLQEHTGKYDYVIVLAYVPEEELWELAENLPETDAVVGGPTGQPVPPTYPQGSVLMISATKQGKFLAVLTLPKTDKKIPGKIIELDERFADDPVQIDNVKTFYTELKQHDFLPGDTPFVRQPLIPTEAVAGSKACQDCHNDEYRIWRVSLHANAWESLVKQEAQYDPDCQRCHVTGYGQIGGFSSVALSSERFDVGCESCHGGSEVHRRTTSVVTPVGNRAKDRCLNCHDRENSPYFEYDAYWNKIRHGTVE